MRRALLFVAFVATVYLANLALEHHGLFNVPLTPFAASWGAVFAGLAFTLRDALHEAGGRAEVLMAIAVGAVLSYALTDNATLPGGVTSIAVASGIAFAFSELIDLAVYEPLRAAHWARAVMLSGIAGAIADSMLFLWLAFGTAADWPGQTLVKVVMVAAALPLVGWSRSRREARACSAT